MVQQVLHCLISFLATGLQVAIFACLWLMDWPQQPHLLLWCCVVALEIGIMFGVLGFCSSRNWRELLLALVLLFYQFASLLILFAIGVSFQTGIRNSVGIH